MAVTAPSQDTAGAALDAQIATVQALVTAGDNPAMQPDLALQLNRLQVQAVDHYMVTGWLNAATILATYSAPGWDTVGQAQAARVAALQALVNNVGPMPAGNAAGYGSSGWTTVKSNYQQQLYAAQIGLVEHLMDIAAPTAAAILSSMTGTQSFTFEYSFTGVGYSDAWIEG